MFTKLVGDLLEEITLSYEAVLCTPHSLLDL